MHLLLRCGRARTPGPETSFRHGRPLESPAHPIYRRNSPEDEGKRESPRIVFILLATPEESQCRNRGIRSGVNKPLGAPGLDFVSWENTYSQAHGVGKKQARSSRSTLRPNGRPALQSARIPGVEEDDSFRERKECLFIAPSDFRIPSIPPPIELLQAPPQRGVCR